MSTHPGFTLIGLQGVSLSSHCSVIHPTHFNAFPNHFPTSQLTSSFPFTLQKLSVVTAKHVQPSLGPKFGVSENDYYKDTRIILCWLPDGRPHCVTLL